MGASNEAPAPRVAPTAVLLILFLALAAYGVVTVLLPALQAAPEGEDEVPGEASAGEDAASPE